MGDRVAGRRGLWERVESRLRRGPLAEDAFVGSRLHDPRTATVLGIALGVAFTVCFTTGFVSHLIQHPASWFTWAARPAGLYRVTQGAHVISGIAAIPLLFAKLFVVYPHFWSWPPVKNPAHGVERLLLLPLVGGSLFLLVTGVSNISGWYWFSAGDFPLRIFFIQSHYAAAWVVIGALVVHVGIKAPTIARSLRTIGRDGIDDQHVASAADPALPPAVPSDDARMDRRGLLKVTFGTAGLLTLLTAGQTVDVLARLNVLAPRDQDLGSQGLPINRTAAVAQVEGPATSTSYRLTVDGAVDTPLRLDLDELRALPRHEAMLPMACVEGWSKSADWRGVRVRDLLAMAGAAPGAEVVVHSLEQRGSYRRSTLLPTHTNDPDTLLALELNGEELNLDHGFPCRLIAPNRPGVMQTKWVTRLQVIA